jgi:hypothetical protein
MRNWAKIYLDGGTKTIRNITTVDVQTKIPKGP